jgi:signal peptidase II
MLIWFLLSVVLLVLDQITKTLVMANLPIEGDSFAIIQDFFHFTHVRNSGAIFGFGGDQGWTLYFFIGAAFLASVFFVVLLVKADHKNKKLWVYLLALSLLIAGTLGNCIDRIFQVDHQVVDFIDFRGIWPYVFNVADMCLTVGISLFLFDQIILEPIRVKKNEQS